MSFGQRADIVVNKGEDGNISISESHGSFANPDSKLSFAKITGWIEKGMSDNAIAERFQDTLFVARLGNSIFFHTILNILFGCKDAKMFLYIKIITNKMFPNTKNSVNCVSADIK